MTETPIEKYLNVIGAYDNEYKKWEARSAKIVKRYRDDNRSQTYSISNNCTCSTGYEHRPW